MVLSACSESSIVRADVADVCGQDGPAQILALETDEVVDEHSAVRDGDRVFYTIRRFDHPITNVTATHYPPEHREYDELGVRVESVGRCGEDRRLIGEGFDTVIPPRAPDDAWLGFRSDTREVFWIDVDGIRAPRRLLEVWSLSDVVSHRDHVFAFSHEQEAMLRFTLAPEQIEVDVIDDVIQAQLPQRGYREWPGGPDAMLVLGRSGSLSSIDFMTARATPVLTDVAGFSADHEHQRILWTENAGRETRTTQPWSTYLVDVASGMQLRFDTNYNSLMLRRNILLVERRNAQNISGRELEFVVLTEMMSVALDGDWELLDSLPDGTFAAYPHHPGPSVVYQPRDGQLHRIAEVDGGASLFDGQLWTSSCNEESCKLFSQSLPDGAPHFVEDVAVGRFGQQIRVPGGRSIELEQPIPDPEAWRPDTRSKLWVRDDETGERALLDVDVSPEFVALMPHDTHPLLGWHTDEIVYQVRDLRSDRTGLWRARFE